MFANAGDELEGGVELYGWASYQNRDARSAGFFRRALDDRNVIQIYPDGFLPIIAPEVTDYSAAGGATWDAGEWDLDTSLVYGKNEMQFGVENTLNRSMGTASPTQFDAGGFDYDQLVLNFSAVRAFDVDALASPLNVATGIEARDESYSIFAGEPSSYINGGVLLPNGTPTASGAQVFPGFRPAERDRRGSHGDRRLRRPRSEPHGQVPGLRRRSRRETTRTSATTSRARSPARYDFTDSFALRGSAQTGFRAPSLQQQFFATTSTNFIAGIPYDITTFPVSDPVARALGAQDLDAEEAVNFSLGAVMSFAARDAHDRRLSASTSTIASCSPRTSRRTTCASTCRARASSASAAGASSSMASTPKRPASTSCSRGRSIRTRAGQFDTTIVANHNNTDVTRVPATAPLAALNPPPPLFARVNVLTFEEGNPDSKFARDAQLEPRLVRRDVARDALRRGARSRSAPHGHGDRADRRAGFVIGSQTLVDLEGRFEPTERLRIAIGAENLLDEFPDAFPVARNATGNTPFSNYAPFGRSGRFLYGRVTFGF